MRKNANASGEYKRSPGSEDPRFIDNIVAIQSIVTSHAQNDSGLFELNFNDERYLPFEGAGAISEWHIELDRDSNNFDISTISDVILHVRCTAREGGEQLKDAAKAYLREEVLSKIPSIHSFSVAHEFPNEWYKFLHTLVPADSNTGETEKQVLLLPLKPDRFPFAFRDKTISISKVEFFLLIKDRSIYSEESGSEDKKQEYDDNPFSLYITPPTMAPTQNDMLTRNPKYDGLPHLVYPKDPSQSSTKINRDNYMWTLEVKDISFISDLLTVPKDPDDLNNSSRIINVNMIDDLIVVCHCSGLKD